MDTDLIIGCKYRKNESAEKGFFATKAQRHQVSPRFHRWRGFAIRAKIKAIGHGLQIRASIF
jgi:hypothetical protein